MKDEHDCTYQYFKASGKWGYEGRGKFPPQPDGWREVDRKAIMAANGGGMPGINSEARYMYVVVLPDEDCSASDAYPRFLKPTLKETEQ